MVNKSSLAKKLASYSAVAAAVLAVDRQADAQIVYTAVNPAFIGHDTTYNLDLNNDGIIDFRITQEHFYTGSPGTNTQNDWGTDSSFVNVSAIKSNAFNGKPYNYGSIIKNTAPGWNNWNQKLAYFKQSWYAQDYSMTFYTGPWLSMTFVPDTSFKYLPLKLQVSGNTYYGWARLKVSADTFILTSYAYNSVAGDSIEAGYTGCSASPVTPVIKKDGDTLISSTAKTYEWYYDGTPLLNDTSIFILPADSGYYSVRTTDSNGCLSQSIALYDTTYQSLHVWPGDANEDLVVNNYDLLPIGLYYGVTGPLRDTTTILWAPHSAHDWDSTQINGMNRKFVDCNGDGIINSDDTLAVSINYGLMHPNDSPPHTSRSQSGTVPLYFVTDYPAYEAGSPVHVQVWLGNNATPDTTIYGIAYNIGFDASAIQPNTLSFTYDSSFIGVKNKTALTLTHINNDVETAVVGTDHTNKTGYGKIGDLYFTLSQTTSDTSLQFFIINYEAVDAAGNNLTLLPVNDTISITNTTTGVKNSPLASESISIFPDPAKNQIIITSNQLSIQQIQIDNVLGQVIYLSPKGDFGVKHTIDISSLPAGMYFYRVTTSNSQIITGKFVKE